MTGAEVDREAILTFARRTYGPDAHQGRAAYPRWAYEENPHCADGLRQMPVALAGDGRVVGFVNRFYMTWDVDGHLVRIPAITDLAVDKDERQGGLGLRLVLAATKDVEHAFINGSNRHSSPLFRGLKYQELKGGMWMRGALAPLRGGLRYLRHRILHHVMVAPLLPEMGNADNVQITNRPDDTLLAQAATLLNGHPAPIKLHWTAGSVRWRFFHPLGPRHSLLFTRSSTGAMDGVLVLASGTQRGIPICRPVVHSSMGRDPFERLLGTALRTARHQGIDGAAAFTFDPMEAEVMHKLGLHAQTDPPATFFHHARRSTPFPGERVLIQGAASDIGFTGIPH